MSSGHLTRRADGHLTRSAARSPDSSSGDVTIRDALEAFLTAGRARGLSPKTLAWYRMIGERFAAYCQAHHHGIGVRALTAAEARDWVVSLQASGLAPVSVAGFVRGVKAMSAWWAVEGYVDAGPLRRLARPRAPQRLIATLTPSDLERLLAVARARERLLIGVLLDTGLRLGEIADLRVDDVLADGYLRVRGKGDKERLVPLGSVSQARLGDYLRRGRPRPAPRSVRSSTYSNCRTGVMSYERALLGSTCPTPRGLNASVRYGLHIDTRRVQPSDQASARYSSDINGCGARGRSSIQIVAPSARSRSQ